MAKKLKPVYPSTKEEIAIAKIMLDQLYELIFKPILADLKGNGYVIRNSINAVRGALLSGAVSYDGFYFSGKYNKRVSKELRDMGAKYSKRIDSWRLEQNKVPVNLIPVIVSSREKTKKITANIIATLDNLKPEALILKYRDVFTDSFYKNIVKIDQAITADLKEVISVAPQLSEGNKLNIAKAYSDNMELYIVDFADKEIKELRKLVAKNVYKGNRANELEKIIVDRYGVSARKAKFLANQETSLLTSKYTQEKYRSAGVEKYMWSTSQDVRVRHTHEELNGKVFLFNSPPITNKETGARNNPGEDYGCRCVAIPIIE
jgi:SPP1 gp7 family putative phage head morphogenesis protein